MDRHYLKISLFMGFFCVKNKVVYIYVILKIFFDKQLDTCYKVIYNKSLDMFYEEIYNKYYK